MRHKYNSCCRGLAAVFACATSLLIAPVAVRADTPVTLRYKYKAGETSTYQSSGQISIPLSGLPMGAGPKGSPPPSGGFNVPLNSTQSIKVVKVMSDGTAELEISTTASATMPGIQAAPTTANTTTKVIGSPLGVLSGAKAKTNLRGAGVGALTSIGSTGSIFVYLPSKPVKPGDTWSQKVNLPQSSDVATVSATFVKYGQVGRYKTAHIKMIITVPVNSTVGGKGAPATQKSVGKITISGKVTMTYDDDFAIEEGKLIKCVGTGSTDLTVKQSGAPTPGGGPNSGMLSAKLTMSSTLMR